MGKEHEDLQAQERNGTAVGDELRSRVIATDGSVKLKNCALMSIQEDSRKRAYLCQTQPAFVRGCLRGRSLLCASYMYMHRTMHSDNTVFAWSRAWSWDRAASLDRIPAVCIYSWQCAVRDLVGLVCCRCCSSTIHQTRLRSEAQTASD